MERRKFTREFKLEAVRLIKNRGVSYVQASQHVITCSSPLRPHLLMPRHAVSRAKSFLDRLATTRLGSRIGII
jgi:transposase-like protein